MVAQLRDEIHSLQNSVQQAERATTVDIHVWLRNLQELRSSHSDGAINELLAEFCKRVGNIIPSEAVTGRWCSDVFCVLVRSELARRISTDWMLGCVGRYLSMADGSASTLNVDGAATCVKLQHHESAEALFEKIDKLHFSLSR